MRFLVFLLSVGLFAQAPFALKNGDRVVFYGDSITDQRLYTTFAETFVVTRFPDLNVTFIHSGWGGDRVSGGGGGNIKTRLDRDVIAYKPTVVTIMLGMNDGRYRAFDQEIYDVYTSGYASMVAMLKQALPGVRIVAIRPSPFDEVTRPPRSTGAYNPVLIRFGDYLQDLAAKEGLGIADLNTDLVKVLEKANATDPTLAQQILPDRVHPGASGHLIMAGSLLKAWNAPALVSAVEIDAAAGRVVSARNTNVSGLSDQLAWTQMDSALPMPVDLNDPVTGLAVKSSDFAQALNQQPLKVTGLAGGHYAVRIEGRQAGVFTADQLASGVNLAMLDTPMRNQAFDVHALTLQHGNVHNARWRTLQVPLDKYQPTKLAPAMASLDALDDELIAKQHAAAKPIARRYELVSVPAEMSAIPSGFTPIYNAKDLTGWHISQVNHHGNTAAWKSEDGVITGTQDKPGNGGILLTDKRYKNFEFYIEVNPDWGCDSGIFLRSTEKGEAYQVLLDSRDGGEIGGVYGERLKGVKTYVPPHWRDHWKQGQWNSIRGRIEGTTPRIQVWMNGAKITDWTDTVNHAADGAEDGMFAVQVHGGTQIWKQGGYQRFRNIAIRELP